MSERLSNETHTVLGDRIHRGHYIGDGDKWVDREAYAILSPDEQAIVLDVYVLTLDEAIKLGQMAEDVKARRPVGSLEKQVKATHRETEANMRKLCDTEKQ